MLIVNFPKCKAVVELIVEEVELISSLERSEPEFII